MKQEGLVRRIPNRGCFVTDFSEQDVVEVFTLRAVLESMAIQWATPRLTDRDFATLRGLVEAARQAIARGDMAELPRTDMQFHEYICLCAGHGRLLQVWRAHALGGRV